MISTENKDVVQKDTTTVAVISMPEEIKNLLLVICEEQVLKDSIAIWLMLKQKVKENKLELNEGMEMELLNSLILRLIEMPYKQVASVLNFLLDEDNITFEER